MAWYNISPIFLSSFGIEVRQNRLHFLLLLYLIMSERNSRLLKSVLNVIFAIYNINYLITVIQCNEYVSKYYTMYILQLKHAELYKHYTSVVVQHLKYVLLVHHCFLCILRCISYNNNSYYTIIQLLYKTSLKHKPCELLNVLL